MLHCNQRRVEFTVLSLSGRANQETCPEHMEHNLGHIYP